MITARNSLYPEFKTKGYFGFNKKLMIFTSNQGHYSIEKTAMALGLGTGSVIKVPCDDQGRMNAYELGTCLSYISYNHVIIYIHLKNNCFFRAFNPAIFCT